MIYYTGSESHNKIQTDAGASLGGHVSKSQVPNGALNNIFPAIDRTHIPKEEYDVRLIVIKASVAMNNVRIWTLSGVLSNHKIAAVSPALDGQNNPVFETIVNGNSLPYQATLETKEGEVNALNVGTVLAGSYLGIWIQRNLNISAFTELDGKPGIENLTTDQLENLLDPTTAQPLIDEAQLIIDWS